MDFTAASSLEQLETFTNPSPGHDYTIEVVCPEFTRVYLKTVQPVFVTIVSESCPARRASS